MVLLVGWVVAEHHGHLRIGRSTRSTTAPGRRARASGRSRRWSRGSRRGCGPRARGRTAPTSRRDRPNRPGRRRRRGVRRRPASPPHRAISRALSSSESNRHKPAITITSNCSASARSRTSPARHVIRPAKAPAASVAFEPGGDWRQVDGQGRHGRVAREQRTRPGCGAGTELEDACARADQRRREVRGDGLVEPPDHGQDVDVPVDAVGRLSAPRSR